MKKFTCRSCRNEWYVDESLSGSVSSCPFCRAEIPRPLEPENIDTLGKAIYSAVSALDLDILSQAARMKGYLMDTVCDMPELKKEIRLFFKFFNQDYLSRYKEAFLGDMAAAATVLSRIEYYLVEDEALDKGRARQMIEGCMEAVRYYKGISETAEELFALGKRYYDGTDTEIDYAKAVEYFQKAADQGYPVAQNWLGLCYDEGTGVIQDFEKAAQWYKKAADQGYPDAQNNLGLCYEEGTGVIQDFEKAAQWYKKAADQGDPDAQYNLGLCYENGTGVIQDFEKAAQWYKKAADQGDPDAQYNLCLCYENGTGVTQDFEKAAQWLQKAADQGHEYARPPLEDCLGKIEAAKTKNNL